MEIPFMMTAGAGMEEWMGDIHTLVNTVIHKSFAWYFLFFLYLKNTVYSQTYILVILNIKWSQISKDLIKSFPVPQWYQATYNLCCSNGNHVAKQWLFEHSTRYYRCI